MVILLLALILLTALIPPITSTTTTLQYTQPLPSNPCGGCQITVQYAYTTANPPYQPTTNPSHSPTTNPPNSPTTQPPLKPALYIQPLRYNAKAVSQRSGQCVTGAGFAVNMGGGETMTISTSVAVDDGEAIGSLARRAIGQMLGSSLCVTRAYSTVDVGGGATASIPFASFTSTSSSKSPSQRLAIITTTTISSNSPSYSAQPALTPSTTPPHQQSRKLKIVAGVTTSILGLCALALALLIWRRWRHARSSLSFSSSSSSCCGSITKAGGAGAGALGAGRLGASVVREKQGRGWISGDKEISVEKSRYAQGLDIENKNENETNPHPPSELSASPTIPRNPNSPPWRERPSEQQEQKTIPMPKPQELKGWEPVRYEMEGR